MILPFSSALLTRHDYTMTRHNFVLMRHKRLRRIT